MKNTGRKRVQGFVLTVFLTIFCLTFLSQEIKFNPTAEFYPTSSKTTLNRENPIEIDGNNQFYSIAINESWNGDGSQSNPYILSNYSFKGTSHSRWISIRNTDLYFSVENCSFENISYGIYLENVTNGILKDNKVSEANVCVNLVRVTNLSIINNTFESFGIYGLYTSFSSNVTFLKNKIIGSEDFSSSESRGIVLDGGNGHSVSHCFLTQCYIGLETFVSHNNVIYQNNFTENIETGVYLALSQNNTLIFNTFIANDEVGLLLDYSPHNNIINNTFLSNTLILLTTTDLNQKLIANNTIDGKKVIFWRNENSRTINEPSALIIIINCSNIYVFNQQLDDSSLRIYNSNGIMISHSNFSEGCQGIKITNSQNISISNTNFHTISGAYAIEAYLSDQIKIIESRFLNPERGGINIQYCDNVTIYKNIFTQSQWDTQIYVIESNFCNLSENQIVGEVIFTAQGSYYQFGNYSSGHVIEGNIFSSDQISTGLIFEWINTSLVYNNTFIGHPLHGFQLFSSPGNTILMNKFINSGLIIGGSEFNSYLQKKFENNSVNGQRILYLANVTGATISDEFGQILLAGCQDIEITNQVISNTTVGMMIAHSENIEVKDCEFRDISAVGISNNNNKRLNFASNIIQRCALGFFSTDSEEIIIHDNFFQNSRPAIRIWSCTQFEISENTFVSNEGWFTLQLEVTNNGKILNNLFTKNNGGIIIYFSELLNLSKNQIIDGKERGIYVESSVYINIHNNIISNNTYGIFLGDSSYVTISHNLIKNNSFRGIAVGDSSECNITFNQFEYNSFGNLYLDEHTDNNYIQFNSFIQITADLLAEDNGEGNVFAYNFWSTHTSPDRNYDGIVDVPFPIPGEANNADEYPLVKWNEGIYKLPLFYIPPNVVSGLFVLFILLVWFGFLVGRRSNYF